MFSVQEERPSLALKGTSWGTDTRPKGAFQQGLEVFLEEASRSVNTTGSHPARRDPGAPGPVSIQLAVTLRVWSVWLRTDAHSLAGSRRIAQPEPLPTDNGPSTALG